MFLYRYKMVFYWDSNQPGPEPAEGLVVAQSLNEAIKKIVTSYGIDDERHIEDISAHLITDIDLGEDVLEIKKEVLDPFEEEVNW